MSIYQNPRKLIKSEIHSCWINCTNAYNTIMKDKPHQEIAVAYVLTAMSHLSCIKSVYTCNYNELEDSTVESVIHKFEVFCNELLTNFCTDHSHQWTGIEFTNLEELLTNSGLLEF